MFTRTLYLEGIQELVRSIFEIYSINCLAISTTYLPNVLNRYFVSRSYFDRFSIACIPSRSIARLMFSSRGVNFALKGSGRQFDPLLFSISHCIKEEWHTIAQLTCMQRCPLEPRSPSHQ